MQTGTAKVEIFSDAVTAIIITIMVLELKLPEFGVDQNEKDIEHHLVKVLPHFGAYVFSFIMVGILWFNHHHLFNLLEKSDSFLLGQNLFFLFWMSLIPFVTGVVGVNPTIPLSIALYGFVMMMTSFSVSFMRSHTLNKGLVHTDDDREVEKKIKKVTAKDRLKSFTVSAIYVVSVPLAFVSVYLSYICFLIPIVLFLLSSGVNEKKMSDKVMEKNTL